MVRIRLARAGRKKRPFYHLVVTDSQNARDGRFIERIGIYQPNPTEDTLRVDTLRFDFWVNRGAQPSERVNKIVRAFRSS